MGLLTFCYCLQSSENSNVICFLGLVFFLFFLIKMYKWRVENVEEIVYFWGDTFKDRISIDWQCYGSLSNKNDVNAPTDVLFITMKDCENNYLWYPRDL